MYCFYFLHIILTCGSPQVESEAFVALGEVREILPKQR